MKNTLILWVAVLTLGQMGFTADPPTSGGFQPTPEMMKLMTPSEGHQALNDTVGKFKYTMKWWMTPDSKAEESKGTSTSKWILGKRFVQQDVRTKMNGQPFEGLGLTGFDNVKQEYQSVWLDNMGTGLMYSTGTRDSATSTVNTSGTFACPMTGDKSKWFRTELKVLNKNEHIYAMYGKTPEGKEFKNMEIHYKRVN